MAYRDSFEQCPRCSAALVDSGAVRACQKCQGQWVPEPILSEMIMTMLPGEESAFGMLLRAVIDRGGERLSCPTCSEPLEPATIHGVTLDRCARQHGVWFDSAELQASLRAIGQYGLASPPRAHSTTAPGAVAVVRLEFVSPGDIHHEVTTDKPIIRIGSHVKCEVRVAADPYVASMHAVIEAKDNAFVLIDLGAPHGTRVNGANVTTYTLSDREHFYVGSTSMTFQRTRS